MKPLTPDDVKTYLGDVSDELMARVLATGATCAELARAAREIEVGQSDEPDDTDGMVHQLCLLIGQELDEEIGPDD